MSHSQTASILSQQARRVLLSQHSESLSLPLVACNVYVSAGGGKPRHIPLLLNVLKQAQELCVAQQSSAVVVVHAFADPVYNRSSFHLAGSAQQVAAVASHLVCSATAQLRDLIQEEDKADNKSGSIVAHPYVGLVDHVAVMPLLPVVSDDATVDSYLKNNNSVATMTSDPRGDDDHNDSSNDNNLNLAFTPRTPSGWAARIIGQAVASSQPGTDGSSSPVQVFYYGTAHPTQKSLAQVRRTQTPFFQSGGLSKGEAKTTAKSSSLPASTSDKGVVETTKHEFATVGAPLHFVENYNIRLRSGVDQKTARSLTRRIRERDGGLLGVEALTLPYSRQRWEVACNLQRPHVASVDDVQELVEQWQAEQREDLVERCYRVGTTADQCLRALSLAADVEERQRHDEQVWNKLRSYATSDS